MGNRWGFTKNLIFCVIASIRLPLFLCKHCRGVAQSGSVLDLGSRSRRFKSSHPDHFMFFMSYTGILFCLSGPAGAGKDSIKQGLLARNNALSKWVSTSSRAPRKGEVEGRDYFFISQEDFKNKISRGEFIEYDSINNSYYVSIGTKEQFDTALRNGQFMVHDITIDGVRALKKLYGKNIICIFIAPPSLDEIEKRLKLRGDTPEVIQARLELAETEMKAVNDATIVDHVVLNDELDRAVNECEQVIQGYL